MTTLQKTIIGATLAAAVGTGIYEARQASNARAEAETLRQQQAPLNEQIQQLTRERDDATGKLVTLREEVNRFNRDRMELLRLRNQLSMLRRETSKEPDESVAIEPSYEGRTLSEWLADLDVPINVPNPKADKAKEAIRAMGTNTFPFLIKSLSGGAGDTQMRRAVRGFEALGSEASSLITEFPNLFEKSPGYSLSAFAAIGKETTPMLIEALTHKNAFVRNNAAGALTQQLYDGKITPQDASEALLMAFQNLAYSGTDTNYPDHFPDSVRWRAAALVGALGLQPEDSIRALLTAMNNSGDSVVVECAEALEKFNAAKAAIPALTRVANSATNQFLRKMAQDALDRINKMK
jgi:hypothetical protein